jgi:transcription elongation factor GreA
LYIIYQPWEKCYRIIEKTPRCRGALSVIIDAARPPGCVVLDFAIKPRGVFYMKQYYFTEAGYEKLRKEIEQLERYIKNDIAKEIAAAREHGDLSENAEYESAKNKQANYMAKLGLLQERFQNARIIRKSDLPEGVVTLGKMVTIVDVASGQQEQYTILGDGETDLENGIISYLSPLAKALMNHKIGEVAEVKLPRGMKKYEIKEINFYEDI